MRVFNIHSVANCTPAECPGLPLSLSILGRILPYGSLVWVINVGRQPGTKPWWGIMNKWPILPSEQSAKFYNSRCRFTPVALVWTHTEDCKYSNSVCENGHVILVNTQKTWLLYSMSCQMYSIMHNLHHEISAQGHEAVLRGGNLCQVLKSI